MAIASSSSSSIPPISNYDVFLSFRGEDTRNGFTSHLYAALCREGIETYIDDDGLERGDKISVALIEAISKSKLSVIIFSENYASSSWCLNELAHILQCKENYGQIVLPVFYGVDPSCVRKHQGSYATSLAQLDQKRFQERMPMWKASLTVAANLSGWDSLVTRPEAKLVEKIVEDILKKLNGISLNTKNSKSSLVGINKRMETIEALLHIGSTDIRCVGIWGMGGIGKTTLAMAVFNQISSNFDSCCFLANVREEWEKGRKKDYLQKKLWSKLLKLKDQNVLDDQFGVSPFHKERLRRKKVLIVLDDVSDPEQLELLDEDHDGYWFGPQSRIIITTRDMQVLRNIKNVNVERYEVQKLNNGEAFQLFLSHAFRRDSPTATDYIELTQMVVNYAHGIPLALKVLGSHLCGKSKETWKDAMTKLKKVPHKDIQSVLRISYDGLDRNQQEIFLDVACFFKGECRDFIERILDGCGFSTKTELDTLVDMSLIYISEGVWVYMHDLLEQMGKEIVRQEPKNEAENFSRLWKAEEVCQILETSTGNATIKGIWLDMSTIREFHLSPTAFSNMCNLRLMKIYTSKFKKKWKVYLRRDLESLPNTLRYLSWDAYPAKSLPPSFTMRNLVELDLPNSQLEQLWDGFRVCFNL